MPATAEHLRIVASIDLKMKHLLDAHCDDVTIFGAMVDHMTGFKQLLDGLQAREIDELANRFPSFYRYAKILENIAGAIQSGAIPRY